MKKIIVPGLIAGVATLVASFIIGSAFKLFPAVAADYGNAALIRPFNDPMMSLFFLYPFVLGVILSWAWNKSKQLFQGAVAANGAKFGLSIWLITTVPGMLISYSSFPISFLTILSWTVDGLAACVITGMIVAKINR